MTLRADAQSDVSPLLIPRSEKPGNCCFSKFPPRNAKPMNLTFRDTMPCDRKVAWNVQGVGDMCDWHFSRWFEGPGCECDPKFITRLSNNDRDFREGSVPGRAHNESTKNYGTGS